MPSIQVGHALSTLPQEIVRGLKAIEVCSAVSMLTTSSLLIFLAYDCMKDYFASSKNWGGKSRKSNYPQGYFWLVNLFVADLVQSFGCLLGSHWLAINSIGPGAYCNFQAIALNSGELGSALWTFVVALSTFLAVAGGPRVREWVVEKSSSGKGRWVLTFGIWAFILFIGVYGLIFIQPLHPEKGPYCIILFRFAITLDDHIGVGWCWIDQQFFWELFAFADMLLLTILYSILFFYIRVQLKKMRQASSTNEFPSYESNLEGGKPVGKIVVPHRIQTGSHQAERRMKQVSLTLLFYPAAYIVVLMPLSIARLRQFSGRNPSLTFTYTAAAIFDCQGFINVLLYTTTRKGLISWDWLFRKFNRGTSEDAHIPAQDSTMPSTISTKHSVESIASFSQYYPPVPEKCLPVKFEAEESDKTEKCLPSPNDVARDSFDMSESYNRTG